MDNRNHRISPQEKAEIRDEIAGVVDRLLDAQDIRGFFAVIVATRPNGEGRRGGLLKGALSRTEIATNGTRLLSRIIESMDAVESMGKTHH